LERAGLHAVDGDCIMGIRGSFFLMLFINVMQTANVLFSFWTGAHPALLIFAVIVLVYALHVTRKTFVLWRKLELLKQGKTWS